MANKYNPKLYRGLTAAQYEEFQKTGVVPVDGRIINEYDTHTAEQVMGENKNVTTVKSVVSIDAEEAKVVMDGNKTQVNVGDFVKDAHANGGEAPNKVPKVQLKHFRGGMIAGATLFGVGVIAHISNELGNKRRVDKVRAEQEDALYKKQKREEQDMRKMFAYDYVDYGNIVQDMWNNRTGHHKMGNSKFQ